MKLAARRTSAVIAAMATAGFSSLFLGVAPAGAAPTDACGATGDLVAPGICERVFTAGSATFTPTADMTQLEVLLVGAGGAGAEQAVSNTNGYAAAGGGGEVKIVDFSGSTNPLALTVADAGNPGTVSDGVTSETVAKGADGFSDYSINTGGSIGGLSGNGKPGATTTRAGSGGAGSATTDIDGGAGVVVSTLAPSGSLFSGDTRCFGGGGAAGYTGDLNDPVDPSDDEPAEQGTAGCGAGGPADATATALMTPLANSGGGGGGLNTPQPLASRAGASGVVVVRWTAANVTLTFDVNGHATAPTAQSVVPGTFPVQPADPAALGYVFEGWFTDAALTVPADFAAPLTAPQTFYAKWSVANVTLTFDVNGHGRAPADQSIAPGLAPAEPADPTALGYEFVGWFADAALTIPADFAAPLTAAGTFYAKWAEVLPVTGGAPDLAPLWIGSGALLAGAGLVAIPYMRKRKTN